MSLRRKNEYDQGGAAIGLIILFLNLGDGYKMFVLQLSITLHIWFLHTLYIHTVFHKDDKQKL